MLAPSRIDPAGVPMKRTRLVVSWAVGIVVAPGLLAVSSCDDSREVPPAFPLTSEPTGQTTERPTRTGEPTIRNTKPNEQTKEPEVQTTEAVVQPGIGGDTLPTTRVEPPPSSIPEVMLGPPTPTTEPTTSESNSSTTTTTQSIPPQPEGAK